MDQQLPFEEKTFN